MPQHRRLTWWLLSIIILACLSMAACTTDTPVPATATPPTVTPQTNLPNPASVYCEGLGYRLEIRTAPDGSQSGVCIFPDGSECDEWAFYRGECAPAATASPVPTQAPTQPAPTEAVSELPTAMPINPADYQGWWTYTNEDYGFTLQLPEDWTVEETSSGDDLLAGHLLNIHPTDGVSKQAIRMTFRKVGEDTLLWPTGVGQGEFIQQGSLEIAGEPAVCNLLVCPGGEVTAIYYQQSENQANITRGGLEFGFIFTAGDHCEAGLSLDGKTRLVGEMIIASLQVP